MTLRKHRMLFDYEIVDIEISCYETFDFFKSKINKRKKLKIKEKINETFRHQNADLKFLRECSQTYYNFL